MEVIISTDKGAEPPPPPSSSSTTYNGDTAAELELRVGSAHTGTTEKPGETSGEGNQCSDDDGRCRWSPHDDDGVRILDLFPQHSLGCDLQEGRQDAAEEDRSRKRDEEGESSSGYRPRKKLRLSTEQSFLLEEAFSKQTNPTMEEKSALARDLKLNQRQVEVWFQNRRARTKLKQMEKGCKLWQQRCLMLVEENRMLREVQEQRLLSITATPSYIQTSPPTLSIRSKSTPQIRRHYELTALHPRRSKQI